MRIAANQIKPPGFTLGSFFLHCSKTQGDTKCIIFILQASVTPGFVSELAGLRLKTESFSAGAPLAEIFGQGQGSSNSSSLPQVIKYMPIWFKQKKTLILLQLELYQGQGPRQVFCGGGESNNTKVGRKKWSEETSHVVILIP